MNEFPFVPLSCSRYFLRKWRKRYPELRRVLFNDTTAALCRATTGAPAWLQNEQFVVKLREPTSTFPWHRDSGYNVYRGGTERHPPHVTLWSVRGGTQTDLRSAGNIFSEGAPFLLDGRRVDGFGHALA